MFSLLLNRFAARPFLFFTPVGILHLDEPFPLGARVHKQKEKHDTDWQRRHTLWQEHRLQQTDRSDQTIQLMCLYPPVLCPVYLPDTQIYQHASDYYTRDSESLPQLSRNT